MHVSSRKFAGATLRAAVASVAAKDPAAAKKAVEDVAADAGMSEFAPVLAAFVAADRDQAMSWASRQFDGTGPRATAKKK
jgi:hypothetical protein